MNPGSVSCWLFDWASGLTSLVPHFPICRIGTSPHRAGAVTCNVLSAAGGVRLPLHVGAAGKSGTQGVCFGPCLLPEIRLQVASWVALSGTVLFSEWGKVMGRYLVSSGVPAKSWPLYMLFLRAGQPSAAWGVSPMPTSACNPQNGPCCAELMWPTGAYEDQVRGM